ncbi:hypothetical protein [Chitinophaga sp. 212800010-3]|uniref:hypothetical protein n=1 Tax=unclassified Chitinophaga TaxID=2619133 RepID=UPI002DE41FDF|nr:DUF4397 domain-containing protein [Chitinophaga sp. 212800010-3]
MKLRTSVPLLLLIATGMILYACKKVTDAPLLPENRILQFTVTNAADGPIQGVINNNDTSIVLYIPYYTALITILPDIKLPTGATVTPASNTLLQNWMVKQAMDTPIIYTVKAGNGNTAAYRLKVDGQQPDMIVNEFSTDAANPVVITHRHKSESDMMGISGDNLVPNTKTNFITLVSESGRGYTLETKPNSVIGYKYFTGSIPPDSNALPSGKYYIRVTCFSKTAKLKNPVIIKQLP